MNLNPLYEAARKTGGEVSVNLNVPLTRFSREGEAYGAMPYPGNDIYEFSADFQQVWWYGHLYRFDADQAAIVRAIYTAWENGDEVVLEDQLLRLVGRRRGSVREIFAGHPALDEWIVHSADMMGFSIKFPRRKR